MRFLFQRGTDGWHCVSTIWTGHGSKKCALEDGLWHPSPTLWFLPMLQYTRELFSLILIPRCPDINKSLDCLVLRYPFVFQRALWSSFTFPHTDLGAVPPLRPPATTNEFRTPDSLHCTNFTESRETGYPSVFTDLLGNNPELHAELNFYSERS